MSKSNLLSLVHLAFVIAIVTCGIGWVKNILILINDYAILEMPEFILRIVGIPVAFVGAIMGWC